VILGYLNSGWGYDGLLVEVADKVVDVVNKVENK
jgi:hypothetical protein